MKLLIVVLAVALGTWLWRSRRPPPKAAPPRKAAGRKAVAEMTRCAVCGLHLPLADAERSAQGIYCSVEHRRQIEG